MYVCTVINAVIEFHKPNEKEEKYDVIQDLSRKKVVKKQEREGKEASQVVITVSCHVALVRFFDLIANAASPFPTVQSSRARRRWRWRRYLCRRSVLYCGEIGSVRSQR
jgi:sigma54-dependent transcription regulator